MKNVIAGILLLIAGQSFAQTIPNASFETWATSGPFFAPTGWAVSPGVKQSNQAHTGTYAVMCSVDTFTNPMSSALDTVVGMVYSGAATMGPPAPGANLNGFACTGRPDSLTGFFKFHAMGADTATISITLSRWVAGARFVVARGLFSAATSDSVYQRFSSAINYVSDSTPDTCVIQIVCASPQAPKHMGTAIWVDDLAFTMHTTAIATVEIENSVAIYPVPFTNVLNVAISGTNNIATVTLANINGQIIYSGDSHTINTTELASGIYLLVVTTDSGASVTRKVVKY